MNRPTPHLTAEEIARYCGQKMPPAELLAADRHLASCDACYARMAQSEGFADKLMIADRAFAGAAAGEVEHLGYEQLAALVDNQLSGIDREIVESHLELCAQCETELQELRDLSITMRSPAAASPSPARPLSLREKFAALWRVPAWRMPALALVALACFAALAFLISLPLRRENAALQNRIAELERNNQSLNEQAENMQKEVAALRQENAALLRSSPGEALVALNDGNNHITLDHQGKLSGINAAPRDEQSVKEALQSERVKVPASLAELRGAAGTMMGQSAERGFRLLAPAGVVIESDRPVFRWSTLEGAESYTVTVFDAGLNQVAKSEPLTTSEWRAPAALERGKTYIWQVRAIKGGQETVAPAAGAARVKFKVLEPAKVEEVERARKSYAGSHLLMGLIYADAGLLEDAAREFDTLVKANPQSTIVRKLLHSVNAARH